MMVEIRNLSKYYGRKPILTDFNMGVKDSKIVAVIGDSGNGKSTLLSIIGLLEPFTSGTLSIGKVKIGLPHLQRGKSVAAKLYRISFSKLRAD